jgi:hypothetical protein
MDYASIINENCRMATVAWWPKFAYHFTDVTNAVSILASDRLRSRKNAVESDSMVNDNASRNIIRITEEEVTSYVRFYFRPLTPTQYHNEGYKHPDIRMDDANIPIPIFFILDLEKLLDDPSVGFSGRSQAGFGSDICHGVNKFRELDFKRIYSDGSMHGPDDKQYRQAELLYPEMLNIDGLLRRIVCRNSTEKATLINMLYEKSPRSLQKYENFIVAFANEKLFYKNGLYIEEISYYDGLLGITIADSFSKKDYVFRNPVSKILSPIEMVIRIEWLDSERLSIAGARSRASIDYLNTKHITWKLSPPLSAKIIKAEIWFNEAKVCHIVQTLNDNELLE